MYVSQFDVYGTAQDINQAMALDSWYTHAHTRIHKYANKLHCWLQWRNKFKRVLKRQGLNENGIGSRSLVWLASGIFTTQQGQCHFLPNSCQHHLPAGSSCLSPLWVGCDGVCSRADPRVQCSWMDLSHILHGCTWSNSCDTAFHSQKPSQLGRLYSYRLNTFLLFQQTCPTLCSLVASQHCQVSRVLRF